VAKNILTIKYDREKLIDKYRNMVYQDDAYKTTLLFNRLRENDISNIGSGDQTRFFLYQVVVYGRLGAHAMEADLLLKVLTDEKFAGFDAIGVLNRLSTYFGFLLGVDVYDYYLNFLKDRFSDEQRLLDIRQKPLEKKLSSELHFVDDEDYAYTCVLDKLSKGDYHGAMTEIGGNKQESCKDYKVKNLEIAMLLSLRMNDEAKKQLEELESISCDEVEFFANYYQLAKVDKTLSRKVINLIENSGKLNSFYELSVMLASLYVSENEFLKAVAILKGIKGIKRNCLEVLTILAECYQALGKRSELVQVLRQISVIYPYEIWARYFLIKDAEGETFELSNNVGGFLKAQKKDLKKYLAKKLRLSKNFDELSQEEVVFLFKASEEAGDHSLTKQMLERIYNSKHIGVLFDGLISIQTGPITMQLILQVLIENKYAGEFYVLKDCLLQKHQLAFPVLFKENSLDDDIEKKKYLLSCYAQTYSLLFFMGFDVVGLDSKLDEILTKLYSIKLLDDSYLFRAECVVYILCNFLHNENEYIENSFKYLKKEDKENLLEMLKKLNN